MNHRGFRIGLMNRQIIKPTCNESNLCNKMLLTGEKIIIDHIIKQCLKPIKLKIYIIPLRRHC